MNLKKLELFGFKSFMRKLDIHFSDGITVIVGPNGCGKTNVTDALRWVLGEGNARQLRGNKMEDLIFNGTRDYKPLNVAEVSLTVDNSSGILPVEYSEVTVTRKVYRNGDPEFLINKVPGRLRDIHELFMDTGLGSRAYSVIEREMVEMVLADQPEKRRELLEEAAGIMKYKIRERQAQRKLSATDEDLQRIDDVLREVERQVRSLKRQVGAARRYQEIRDRFRELAISLAVRDGERLLTESASLRETLDENVAEREGAAGRAAALDAEIESARVESTQADAALAERQRGVDGIAEEARVVENENVVRRERRESLLEKSRRLAEERSALEERVGEGERRGQELSERIAERQRERDQAAASLEEAERHFVRMEADLDGRKVELSNAREGLEKSSLHVQSHRSDLANLDSKTQDLIERHRVLSEEIESLESSQSNREFERTASANRLGQLEDRLSSIHDELEETARRIESLDGEREALREEEAALSMEVEARRSEFDILNNLQESYEGFGEGARSLLSRQPELKALADSIHPLRQDLIQALDAALETAIQFVVAPDQDSAISAVRSLRDGEGRATLVDLSGFREARSESYAALPADEAVIGPVRSFLEISHEYAPVVEWLLAKCLVVESLEDGVRLARRPEFAGYRLFTKAGDWVEAPGIVHGGAHSSANESRILGRKDRLSDLEATMGRLGAERTLLQERRQAMTSERDQLRTELTRAESERDGVRQEINDESRTSERLAAETEASESRLATVRSEREGVVSQQSEVETQRERLAAELTAAEGERARLEEAWQLRENELVASTDDRDRAQQACHDGKLATQRVTGELEKLEFESKAVEEARRADQQGIEVRVQELDVTDRTVGELARELEEGLSVFAAKTEELEEARRVRDGVADERAKILDKLRELEEERNRWTGLRDQAADLVHENEMKLTKADLAREELITRVEREFDLRVDTESTRESFGGLLEAESEAVDAATNERDDLQRQMDRLGAVNMVALDQYEREAKRLEFLQAQKNDLEEAREKLRRTIRKVNRTARTMFMETLELVRKNFMKTYSTLFEGGQADIRLSGDEDPLNAPIEIFARPRGKRPSNISLLSSGERSLTAVAFLFAIYLVKPSPFCILDEVDAPLDDANIGRFLSMLKEVAAKTQFVMITHNKKTMEIADYLYGVTMQEPGISKLVSVKLGESQGPATNGAGVEEATPEEVELVMEGSA